MGWIIWHLDQIQNRGIELMKQWYGNFSVKASECVECGKCIERCQFSVDIIARMREAAALFEAGER